jgi:hypothetical protein
MTGNERRVERGICGNFAGAGCGTAANKGLMGRRKDHKFPSMDGIEVIETEWGSELHKRLVAEEHAARVTWRNSPEAWEEARRMQEAGPLEWGRVIYPAKRKKTPIYKW